MTPMNENNMAQKPELFILDDDRQHAELLAELASEAGWNATFEQSASAFLANLPGSGVLVLDLIMPEMDGIEVIRELAERQSQLKIILISGFDYRVLHSAKQLAEAHNITVLDSLTKPIAIGDFMQLLKDIEQLIPQAETPSLDRLPINIEELSRAIREHQLLLHYQPQIDMNTRAMTGVEALVRWRHPDKGLIYPDQFIDLAENTGLIAELTSEVISIAIEQSKQWKQQGIDTVISVNVSASNILSLTLPEQLIELTSENAIAANRLTLEITESAVMQKLTSSLDVLNRLRMKGFSLSIDDFGTGYSSLSQLYQAPFTELKIDQNFVMRMMQDKEAMVIVKICIMLGHMMGMKLVAEGVEDEAIWQQLRELGCDIAQGYFMARPMPADVLKGWLDEWHSRERHDAAD